MVKNALASFGLAITFDRSGCYYLQTDKRNFQQEKMSKNKLKGFMAVILVFIVLNGFFISAKNMLQRWNIDQDVVIIGNGLLFIITLISFLLAQRGLRNPNPHAFVRSVYMSVMLKLFACIIAAFIYIAMYKSNLNKPALFICMGLYLVYTFLEVASLMKLMKQKKNA